jgi:hypothetical protein
MDSPLSPIKYKNDKQRINFKMEYLVIRSKRILKIDRSDKSNNIKRNLVKLKYFY